MNMLGELLGSLAGKATDPVAWAVMVVALILGARRARWWWALVAAAAGAGVVAYIVLPQRSLLGLQTNVAQFLFSQFVWIGILALLAYGLGWLILRKIADA